MDTFIRILNPFLMIALGLGVGAWVVQRYRTPWSLYGVGALAFILSQVFHIPFNSYILAPSLERAGVMGSSSTGALLLIAAAYGLSSGVFEEGTRYLVFRFWRKDIRTWRLALMYGAGHGGIEAVLLGILSLAAAIQLIAIRSADLATLVPPEQLPLAQAQVQAFWNARWYDALLGALERSATIPVHLALSILVLQAFKRKNLAWLVLAIVAHAGVNALALVAIQWGGVYVAEGLVVACGLLALFTVWRLRDPTPVPEPDLPAPQLAIPVALPAGEATQESLEDSRYAE